MSNVPTNNDYISAGAPSAYSGNLRSSSNQETKKKKKKAELAYYRKSSSLALDEQQQQQQHQQRSLVLPPPLGSASCSPHVNSSTSSGILAGDSSIAEGSSLISTQRKRRNSRVIATANPSSSSSTTATTTTTPPYHHFFKNNRTCHQQYYDIKNSHSHSKTNNSTMAVTYTYHNPQDPEQACLPVDPDDDGGDGDRSQAKSGKSFLLRPAAGGLRPYRAALLYLRHRARGRGRATTPTNLTVLVVATLLVTLSVHRVVSLWATHRRWINAPITYMHRQCPAVAYAPLLLGSSNSNNATLAASMSTTTAGGGSTAATDNEQTPPQQREPKICLTTLTDQKSPSKFQRFMRWRNFDGILDLTWDNKQRYADRHSYYLYDGSGHIDPSRPPAWSKIKAVQHLLDDDSGSSGPTAAAAAANSQQHHHQHCDWVMWTDADTVIMNSNIAVASFLPRDATHDLLVASDKGGGYNSGVFLFRNTDWSRQFLERWWSMTDFVRPPGLSLSGDNAAMKALLADLHAQGTFDQHVLSPPRCTFNSFAKFLTLGQSLRIMDHLEEQPWYLDHEHYHKGDFVAHTPGVDNKAEALKLLLREAK